MQHDRTSQVVTQAKPEAKSAETRADHAAMGHDMANGTTQHADMGMLMSGIPTSLYYSSIVVVMLISVAVLELTRRRAHATAAGFRFDLMSIRPFKAAVKSRGTQVAVQMFLLVTFALVIAPGLYVDRTSI